MHLWEINHFMVEATEYYHYQYENWESLIKSEIWERNQIYGCLPVYWIWIDATDEENFE